ncbi:hypothetical protein KFL_001890210 [Klebsormidium nitens]|uniref:Uncharacterized protein n=1 Tax=Klebsormidium nitens TaxID=105231 RepID=A0A1Y1I6V6_KLENI|nr:hypothetical protein KFL_001890210 [Klebsormidium nitens]|eukprot:GAQ84457.1 hypothetical protein KFL_001890210 [Klebsormidium nitens]
MADASGAAAAEVAEVSYTGTALEPVIQAIKQKIGGKESCETYIFEAPNPTISPKEKSGPSSSRFNPPSVDLFKAWGCTIIVLSWQTFFKDHVPEKFKCVKGCGKFTVVRNGWYAKLVSLVLGLHRPLFILSQDYRCKDCHAKLDGKGGFGSTLYLAHKEEIRAQLRPFILHQLPIGFSETCVPVERSLLDLLEILAPEAIGFPRIARLVKELHTLAEKRRELVYYDYQLELKAKRAEDEVKRQKGIGKFFQASVQQAGSGAAEQPVQAWAMGKRVPDWVAGSALLSSLFLQQAAAKMPEYSRQMALVRGECVGMDHFHKLMRRIRGMEGQRVLDATLTMMTETGEVATSLWTHNASLEVVRDNLHQIHERMVLLGRAPRLLFCDWPEVMGPFFKDLWPCLEVYLMDILHAIMRVTKHIPDDHPFRGWFQGKLSEAIFIKNQADLVDIIKELDIKGKTLADKAGKNALRRCRKSVPPPEVLLARLQVCTLPEDLN